VRGYQLVFNVAGDPVGAVTEGYRRALDALASGERPDVAAVRAAVGAEFTRGTSPARSDAPRAVRRRAVVPPRSFAPAAAARRSADASSPAACPSCPPPR
jgi:hypothetical protein